MNTAADSIDAALDAALDMTFPASDPIAVFMPDSSERPVAPGWQGNEVSERPVAPGWQGNGVSERSDDNLAPHGNDVVSD